MDSNPTQVFPFYTTNGNRITTDPFVWIFETRDPTAQDFNYPLQKAWLNKNNEKLWVLTAFSTVTGVIQAVWQEISSSSANIDTITADNAVAVSPVANNVNIFGGSGIITSGSGNTLTISTVGSGLSWYTVVQGTQTIAVNSGYVVGNGAGLVTFSLPSTANVGDTFVIMGRDAGGWTISQGNGQQILVGSVASTLGVAGSVSSTNQYDNVTIRCITANTLFAVSAGAGVYNVI